MNIKSEIQTIKEILSPPNEYHVTRFQREYAWDSTDLQEFWTDILTNITKENGDFSVADYFIGSVVMTNEADSSVYNIVDGQQRITTISILISAIIESLKEEGEVESAKKLYDELIENESTSGIKTFKLINENVKEFLNTAILYYDKIEKDPETNEEKKLWHTLKFFRTNLKKKKREYKEEYLTFLKVLIEEIHSLKTIFISVDDENEAYIIFEILNSKGHDLENIDLIKNLIFKILDEEHPIDSAKSKWMKIKEELAKRTNRLDIDTYFRNYWLGRNGYVSKTKLYQSVKEKIQTRVEANFLLNDLLENIELYQTISNPQQEDWKDRREKIIYKSASALITFNVISPRPLLLSLLSRYKDGSKVVKIKELENFLETIEKFHFIFTAITSQRASGLDRIYTKFAEKVFTSASLENTREIFKEFKGVLKQKLPSKDEFIESFSRLYFTNEETRDKKLIQYIFKKWEESLTDTSELAISDVTIEHIMPQSTGESFVGVIGNLLLLDNQINNEIDRLPFKEKVEKMQRSQLLLVKEFIDTYGEENWEEEIINRRTKAMAEKAYSHLWHIA